MPTDPEPGSLIPAAPMASPISAALTALWEPRPAKGDPRFVAARKHGVRLRGGSRTRPDPGCRIAQARFFVDF